MTPYLRKEPFRNLLLFTLILLTSLVKTATALALTVMLNQLIAGNEREFLVWMAINIVLWGGWILLSYGTNMLKEQVICRMSAALRMETAGKLAHYSWQQYHTQDSGAYVSWLGNDIRIIEDSAFRSLYLIWEGIFTAVFSAVSLWSYDPILAVATLFLSLWIVAVPGFGPLKKYLQDGMEKYSRENEHFLAGIEDVLKGFDEFFTYNLQERMVQKIQSHVHSLNQVTVENARKKNRISSLISVINIASQLLVNLCAGLLILRGRVSAGAIVSVGQLAGNVFNALGNLSSYLSAIRSSQPVLEKLKSAGTAKEPPACRLPSPEVIEMEAVNYDYGRGMVFKKVVSMQFRAGGKYAIVGESGSGKSTLMNILAGKLTDYSGSVRLDGRELKELPGGTVREAISLVNQKPHLFNTSLRENITMGNDISGDQLDWILSVSDLKGLVSQLPQGLETCITGNGENLSGGQRQRIALARALAFGRRILVLDESTSALNEEGAERIESKLLSDKELTVIMITHHLQAAAAERLTGLIRI